MLKSRTMVGLTVTGLLCVGLTSGCATVFKGSGNTVRFETQPAGAQVYLDDAPVCVTPCEREFRAGGGHVPAVRYTLAGYEDGHAAVMASVGVGWVVADILLGGLIAVVVDASSGDWRVAEAWPELTWLREKPVADAKPLAGQGR